MNHTGYIQLRGWYPHHRFPERWTRQGSPVDMACTTLAAYDVQTHEDESRLHAHGSVTYRPTAEQAQTSPLLAACAARGMCERDVIGLLFCESEERRRRYAELVDVTAIPPRFVVTEGDGAALMADMLKRAQAIGAAWKTLARAERHARAVSGTSNVDALNDASHAVTAAAFRLRALGIDPDAADEPGQVQP